MIEISHRHHWIEMLKFQYHVILLFGESSRNSNGSKIIFPSKPVMIVSRFSCIFYGDFFAQATAFLFSLLFCYLKFFEIHLYLLQNNIKIHFENIFKFYQKTRCSCWNSWNYWSILSGKRLSRRDHLYFKWKTTCTYIYMEMASLAWYLNQLSSV